MKGLRVALGLTIVLVGFFPASGETQQVKASPTETYQAFHQALRDLDMEGLKARWLPDQVIAEDEAAIMEKVIQMRQITPPEIEVRSEKVLGSDAFVKVIGFYPNGGKSKGTIYLMRTADRWRVKQEKWGFIEIPKLPPLPKGVGVIEGIVTLPPVDGTGDLYVFAILENQTYPARFTVIPKEEIVWKVVPYRITELPSGTFWVYTYWDTAPPYMDPEKELFAVFTGDYAGEFATTVTLQGEETRSRIDFTCNRNLKARDEENYGSRYTLVDLGLSRSTEGKPLFLLNIRNTGEKPVRNVSLICTINGKDLDYTASAPGTLILPNEVRAFDITACYDSYLFFLERVWFEEELSRDQLTIEISSRDNDTRLRESIKVQ